MAASFSDWSWMYVCPTGLTPWQPEDKYLAPCFQQICLQLPTLALFAATSAYFFGKQTMLIARNRMQHFLIYVRLLAVLLLIVLAIYEIFMMVAYSTQIWPIDVLLSGVKIVTLTIHLGFLLSLRNHGDLSHRGPLFIVVVWLLLALLTCVWLRTSIMLNNVFTAAVAIVLHSIYGLSLMPSGKATYVQRRNANNEEQQSLIGNTYIRFQDDLQIQALGQASDDEPWLSKLIFYWVNALIEKGLNGHLRRIDDLFDLPDSLLINRIAERLHNAITRTMSLFRSLHRVFGVEFYAIGLLRFTADMLGFAGPLLLAGLLKNQSNEKNGTDLKAYGYASGLFATALLSALFGIHFNWRMSLISLKMRTGITTAIYRKTLEAHFVNSDSPEVLNLMSTDTDRIVNSCISFHSFWSIPFQLFATLYLLYTQIGIAFAGGVIFAIILIPINRWLANKISSLSADLLAAKDARVSQSYEAFTGAKQIKILAWEDVFIEKIQKFRSTELTSLSKRKYLDALCVYFWATTPIIINLLTFGTATMIGQPMTAATTFASVALLNMLIGPLNTFPWVLNGLVEAWISLRRVQSYLDLPEMDLEKFYSPMEPSSPQIYPEKARKPVVISLQNALFCFNSFRNNGSDNADDVQNFVLKPVSCYIKQMDLVCLEGPVGSGKSAFLNAINGNLNRISGNVQVQNIEDGFGYVAQQPWLQHGTIRDNIIWGEIFDEQRYRNVLWSCALHKDLEDLGGDNFDIGEGGCTLSGGQKARVALARAVYQDKQIYLIDDVLASLDAHVANHIVKHCILGLLKDRTRIIVTENRTLFYYSNEILHVEDGAVSTSDFALGSFESKYDDDEQEDELHSPNNFESNTDDNVPSEISVFEESKETGALSSRVLAVYWKACGTSLCLLVFLSIVLMQASKNFSDAWLAHWIMNISPTNSTLQMTRPNIGAAEYAMTIKENVLCILKYFLFWHGTAECVAAATSNVTNELGNEHGVLFANSYYLSIYIGIAVFNSIFTLLRAFAFAYAGLKAAKFMHNKLLNSVFYAEFSFFDITPLGRILNRFSSDTYTVDDSLPFIMNILFAQLAGLIGALCISLYAMPWLALLIVPMCPIYLSLQHRYRNSSRDIKRLLSNSLSPIYTHFTETLQGLATIRAMRANQRFHRDFLVKLEDCIRAQLTASSAQQWLGLRLQLLGAFLVGGSGFIAVITSANSDVPEMVGLVISYSLSLTGLLSGVLNALTETEQELVAVERIHGYCKLKPEKNASGARDPPFGWPCQGLVKFDNVSLKYRPYLPPSLNQINFQTSSCERIGIVGRTGAGKSSIMAALIRIAPLSTGRITIDTVDISTLPLHVLRSRISLVPQDSFLFSGTIRENMDPRNLHLDSDIWNAINRCLASPLVQSLGGLNAYLDARGSNISAGQKQLLCLARALLRKSKIVVIDEGTSNLDSDSENAIQLILRNAFKSSTVLLIAHRLHGLQQTDRILVIDNGQIVEEGKPEALANDSNSKFFAMLQEQQMSPRQE